MTASSSSIPLIAEALKLRVTTSHMLTRILPLGTVTSLRPSGSVHTKSVKDSVPHGVADKLSTVTVPRIIVWRAITSLKITPIPRLAMVANTKKTIAPMARKAAMPLRPFLYNCLYFVQ